MERTFIEVPSFTKKWYALGLTNDDLIALQNAILQDPKGAGALIPGTGSMRKIRVPLKGHGKRGGARV
ncbi:MAG: addiction module toxin RelE, partial [Ruminococcus sp.]|nr:addiction module toxin RelE [Ruminococcus sp.]